MLIYWILLQFQSPLTEEPQWSEPHLKGVPENTGFLLFFSPSCLLHIHQLQATARQRVYPLTPGYKAFISSSLCLTLYREIRTGSSAGAFLKECILFFSFFLLLSFQHPKYDLKRAPWWLKQFFLLQRRKAWWDRNGFAVNSSATVGGTVGGIMWFDSKTLSDLLLLLSVHLWRGVYV